MRSAKSFALCFVPMLVLGLTGCSDPEGEDKTPPPPCDPATNPDCACLQDSDCGEEKYYICNISGRCEKACTTKEDCLTHPAGAFAGCDSGLGCVCDARRCLVRACTSDSECTSPTVCKAGACGPPEVAASCKIFPERAILAVNEEMTFDVVAYKADGTPAAVGAGAFSWDAAAAVVTKVSDGIFKGAAAAAAPGLPAVRATVNGKQCLATLIVLPASTTPRVTVIDEMTGRPITGARVYWDNDVNNPTNANLLADGDNDGVYEPAGTFTATTPATVSVFHANYQYVTLIGVDSKELYVPIRRQAGDKKGGFGGKFTNLPTKEVAVGIAGASFPGGFTDLDFELIVGEGKDTTITLGGYNQQAPIPAGIVLATGQTRFKETYEALGTYGVCDKSSPLFASLTDVDLESRVTNGTCGTRSAWSLMGEVPLGEVLKLVTEYTEGTGLDPAKVLNLIMPYLMDFKSQVIRDVQFKLDTTPQFTAQDLAPAMALTLKSTINVPKLPGAVSGATIDGALVIAGTLVPGRGMVPLGMTAGMDVDNENPALDGWAVGLEIGPGGTILSRHNDGKLALRMAPPHGGIEGSKYAVVAIGVPSKLTTEDGNTLTSALVSLTDKLPYGSEVAFNGSFLGFSDVDGYEYTSGTFTGAKLVPGATVHRMVFSNEGKRWNVYFKGANPTATTATFKVPPAPASFADLTMAAEARSACGTTPATCNAKRASYTLQALKLANGTTPMTMEDLFGFGRANGQRIADHTVAFSTYERIFDINFQEPANCNKIACSLPSSGFVFKVQTTGGGSAIVNSGKVVFSAESVGAATPVTKGPFQKTLTAREAVIANTELGLTPGTWKITAKLLNAQGTDFNPPVKTTIEVTMQ